MMGLWEENGDSSDTVSVVLTTYDFPYDSDSVAS